MRPPSVPLQGTGDLGVWHHQNGGIIGVDGGSRRGNLPAQKRETEADGGPPFLKRGQLTPLSRLRHRPQTTVAESIVVRALTRLFRILDGNVLTRTPLSTGRIHRAPLMVNDGDGVHALDRTRKHNPGEPALTWHHFKPE